MRPPDLPGGNLNASAAYRRAGYAGFNEAAGFTRRKPLEGVGSRLAGDPASMRPPDLPGGNDAGALAIGAMATDASMRPPDLPGGNP